MSFAQGYRAGEPQSWSMNSSGMATEYTLNHNATLSLDIGGGNDSGRGGASGPGNGDSACGSDSRGNHGSDDAEDNSDDNDTISLILC